MFNYLQYKKKLVREEKMEQMKKSGNSVLLGDGAASSQKKKKAQLDSKLLGRLKLLLSIVVPSYRFVHHTFFFIDCILFFFVDRLNFSN